MISLREYLEETVIRSDRERSRSSELEHKNKMINHDIEKDRLEQSHKAKLEILAKKRERDEAIKRSKDPEKYDTNQLKKKVKKTYGDFKKKNRNLNLPFSVRIVIWISEWTNLYNIAIVFILISISHLK